MPEAVSPATQVADSLVPNCQPAEVAIAESRLTTVQKLSQSSTE